MNEDNKKTKSILMTIVEIIVQIFMYIYDFLFDWSDDEPIEEDHITDEKTRLESVKIRKEPKKDSMTMHNATISIKDTGSEQTKEDIEIIKAAFGSRTADYILQSRKEADYLVKEHGLLFENSIKIVIPPERAKSSLISPEFFEATYERIYSQYDDDIVIKPGEIKIINTNNNGYYLEIEVEAYKLSEEYFAAQV